MQKEYIQDDFVSPFRKPINPVVKHIAVEIAFVLQCSSIEVCGYCHINVACNFGSALCWG